MPIYSRHWGLNILYITLFVAIFILAIALRAHLVPIPLERDEGEYAYTGMLILQGFQPYVDVYSMKMPGIYWAYAVLLSIFGTTPTSIHYGLMLINMATLPLVYILGKRLFNDWVGFTACAAYAFFSAMQSVEGVSANAEHFVVFTALGGIVLLLRAIERDNSSIFFCSGLLFGLAFMMKQHGAFFAAFAGVYLLIKECQRQPFVASRIFRRGLLFLLGLAIPFGLTCLYFLGTGSFERFWFWTHRYARQYVSMVTPAKGFLYFKLSFIPIILSAPLLWLLAGIGLTALYWNDKARSRSMFVMLLFIFSILSIIPGYYFRPHYFILLLPVAALLVGIAVNAIRVLLLKRSLIVQWAVPTLIVLTCVLLSVYQNKEFFFESEPIRASRMLYGSNPFPESVAIGKYIRDHSSRNDLIAVLGSEPQIYFYAVRNAATRHIYAYPLMEKHPFSLQMQKEMAQDIESSNPKFLVFISNQLSWLMEPDSPGFIFEWFQAFHQRFYQKVGVADLTEEGMPQVRWNGSAKGYAPKSRDWVAIYERKN